MDAHHPVASAIRVAGTRSSKQKKVAMHVQKSALRGTVEPQVPVDAETATRSHSSTQAV